MYGVIHIEYLEKRKPIATKAKAAPFGEKKSAFPPGQLHSEQVHSCDGKTPWDALRISYLTTIFPGLISCDHYLFPNFKKWLGRKRNVSTEEVIAETETYFGGVGKSYY